ncbi:MAG: hypothetical protein ACOCZ6_06170 [Nanoarchaeota archaeon]
MSEEGIQALALLFGLGASMVFLAMLQIVLVILRIIIYAYKSAAFMFIGKNANDNLAFLAWIPFVGNGLVAYRASGMHWWPWVFLGLSFFGIFPALIFESLFILILVLLSGLVYVVFFFLWLWKLFEKVGWPGWMALLYLIPIANWVIIGLVAWKKPQ